MRQRGVRGNRCHECGAIREAVTFYGEPWPAVGIEDAYWMYPHRDELIKSNWDVVKTVVEIANLHGRRVVTDPAEARKILGMRLT